jgi:ribosomal protein S12 methylthiotransferase
MRTKKKFTNIHVVTLGCSKNLVDSEFLLKQLDANGIRVIHNSEAENADTVIINTCGFIKDAKEESIDTILRYIKAKEDGLIRNVFVMGCLSQRYKQDLEKEISDVDKYFGTDSVKDIIETLGYNYKSNLAGERLLTTPGHYAYLKISEGCDRKCSFCAIPMIRGRHVSKPIEQLISETQWLVKGGVKEIILIAQDLTYYGVDLYQKQILADLLNRLADIDGLKWLRLHYAYPAGFPSEILEVIRERPNICKYLDIPFQHVNDKVLKKMHRGLTSRQTYDLINLFRNEIPELTLRTTLMVGHPGEGPNEFDELLEFVQKYRFDRLGVFTYSEEEDTFGAKHYADDIPEEVKEKRATQIMDVQQEISYQMNCDKIGKKLKTIIDRKEGEYYIGRTEADSPEVDNEVLVISKNPLRIGEFYEVTVTEAENYDLMAEITGID